MQKVIHLSDLHVGKNDKQSRKRWRAITNYIHDTHPGVPVLITGDITDNGRVTEYETAQAWISELGVFNPVLMVPGNHDYAFKGTFPFHSKGTNLQRWYEYCGTPVGFGQRSGIPNLWMPSEPVWEGYGCFQINDKLMAFYVDSGDPERRKRCATGWISAGMCATLARELPLYDNFTRIVMVHHHPFNHTYHKGLEGWYPFMNVLDGNCELLLFGHDHKGGIWRTEYLQEYMEWRDLQFAVASHATLSCVTGSFGAITIIEITDPATPQVAFHSVLELVDFS